MRKIIQIATGSYGVGEIKEHRLYALCDDGSLWWSDSDSSEGERRHWRKQPPIPQGPPCPKCGIEGGEGYHKNKCENFYKKGPTTPQDPPADYETSKGSYPFSPPSKD